MNLEDLLRDNMIEKVPASRREVEDVFRLAERDLAAARSNLEDGVADWAFNIGYNAMLQAGRALFDYASRRREEGEHDFTVVVKGYSRDVLFPEVQNGKNSLAKRMYEMIKNYAETDPRYQSRLVGFFDAVR